MPDTLPAFYKEIKSPILNIDNNKSKVIDYVKEYINNVVASASAFAQRFVDLGAKVISGGTDNHMFVLDVYSTYGLTGKYVEEFLDKVHITLNKNQIPNDTLPPLKSSGVRIGTPAMTTKGWRPLDFMLLADLIDGMLRDEKREESIDTYSQAISELINFVQVRNTKDLESEGFNIKILDGGKFHEIS